MLGAASFSECCLFENWMLLDLSTPRLIPKIWQETFPEFNNFSDFIILPEFRTTAMLLKQKK